MRLAGGRPGPGWRWKSVSATYEEMARPYVPRARWTVIVAVVTSDCGREPRTQAWRTAGQGTDRPTQSVQARPSRNAVAAGHTSR